MDQRPGGDAGPFSFQGNRIMADRRALRIIGAGFGLLTALVVAFASLATANEVQSADRAPEALVSASSDRG
jgi:hypothetical protein